MNINLKNWNLTRFIGLILGSYFIGDYFATGGVTGLMIGGMILFQVVFNIGCFAGSCAAHVPKENTNYTEEEADLVEVEAYN